MKKNNQPKPGQPVRGSKSGKPVMVLLDLLGRSWAMGIIWHLSNGACTFRKLQSLCESISPTTLNKRIKELTTAGFIMRTIDGYTLTKQGKELFNLLHPVGEWAKKWAANYPQKN